MKTKIFLFALVGILLGACSEEFIELTPPSDANLNDFYKTTEDFETAMNAVYGMIQNRSQWNGYTNLMMYYGDVWSDASFDNGTSASRGLDEFQLQSFDDDGHADNFWNDAYNTIMRINNILAQAENADIDEDVKTRTIGEAKFMRALWYFALVRLFGPVPLVDRVIGTEEAYQFGRAPVDEVYQLIISDAQDAISNLPLSYSGDDKGRVTSGAARTLLAKVYLTRKNYQDAKTQLEAIINSDQYKLLDDYADLWGLDAQFNEESIFEAVHKSGNIGEGSRFTNETVPNGSTGSLVDGESLARSMPTDWLLSQFEEGDLRYEISFDSGFVNPTSKQWVDYPWSTKYYEAGITAFDSGLNFMIYRYADVLLMYAEVLNELNGPTESAQEYLNMIRDRAGLEDVPTDLTKEEFRDAIFHERFVELNMEHHRWFDLQRMGKEKHLAILKEHFEFLGEVDRDVPEYMLWLPIPLQQIQINPNVITQNEGY